MIRREFAQIYERNERLALPAGPLPPVLTRDLERAIADMRARPRPAAAAPEFPMEAPPHRVREVAAPWQALLRRQIDAILAAVTSRLGGAVGLLCEPGAPEDADFFVKYAVPHALH